MFLVMALPSATISLTEGQCLLSAAHGNVVLFTEEAEDFEAGSILLQELASWLEWWQVAVRNHGTLSFITMLQRPTDFFLLGV